MSPEQRRARRISAANRPENVPRPDFKSRTTFGAKLFKNFQKLSNYVIKGVQLLIAQRKKRVRIRGARSAFPQQILLKVCRVRTKQMFLSIVRAAPGRGAGPGERRARAWTRTVLQPIARCPTFALRPRKSFAIVHRDRSLRSLRIGAIAGFDAAAPLRVLRWASRRDWARIGESRAEVSGECSQDFQELRSSAGPGARRSGRPGPRSGQRQAGGAGAGARPF